MLFEKFTFTQLIGIAVICAIVAVIAALSYVMLSSDGSGANGDVKHDGGSIE